MVYISRISACKYGYYNVIVLLVWHTRATSLEWECPESPSAECGVYESTLHSCQLSARETLAPRPTPLSATRIPLCAAVVCVSVCER